MKLYILILFSLLSFASYASFSMPKNVAKASIIINAPIEDVWDYTNDDRNARKWSVYFYKITACPQDECPENITKRAGDVGYVRRCFKYEDETRKYWDEKTIFVEKGEKKWVRTIVASNFFGVKAMGFHKKGQALVKNIFERVGKNKTKLTFITGLIKRSENTSSPNRIQYAFWKFVTKNSTIKRTRKYFYMNLVNIKKSIEDKEDYKRVFPYNPRFK